MGKVNFKDYIQYIWNASEVEISIAQSSEFYTTLLKNVEELYIHNDTDGLMRLLEGLAEENHTFPFLHYVRHNTGVKKLSFLQHTLTNIKNSLISFITNKFQMTEINPSTLGQFLHFTETVDPVSERLFMNVIPEYMKQNKESLIPGDFKDGLYQALLLDEKDFRPYISVVNKIIDEYEHDFLLLNNYTLYPLKDILFYHAQKSALEEKYLLLYSWIASLEDGASREMLVKTTIPPYLYSFFQHGAAIAEETLSQQKISGSIRFFAHVSEKAAREGLLSLEDDIEEIHDDGVLKTGLQLIVDGTEQSLVQSILEDKIAASMYIFTMKQRIITRGLLSIFLGDNPRITEEIMRSITLGMHNNQVENLIEQLSRYSQKARIEGVLALEDELTDLQNILLKQGIQYLVSGMYFDFIQLLLDSLSRRLEEEEKLYYSIIKSGIMHLACGTPARTIEKHLHNMVPFLGNMEGVPRLELKKQESLCIYNKLCKNHMKRKDKFYTLYDLLSTIISYKSGLIGFYTYYTSYFTGNATAPDFQNINNIFLQNSIIAEHVLADKEEIPVFTLPIEYKNELLSQIAGLEKVHSSHNAALEEKVNSLSENLDDALNATMIQVKRDEAEKHPSIENLSFLSEEEKIIRFLKGLGELHKAQAQKYATLFSELAEEFLAGITTLSKDIFSFVPDFSDINESPHLSLTLILQIILKNDFLLSKIDSIFSPDLARLVMNQLFPFHDIVYISDNGMKEIISHLSIQDLSYALKTADSYIQDKFFHNLSESACHELMEQMEFSGSISEEDGTGARNKILLYAFKLEEMASYLAFQAIKKKSVMDTFDGTV